MAQVSGGSAQPKQQDFNILQGLGRTGRQIVESVKQWQPGYQFAQTLGVGG